MSVDIKRENGKYVVTKTYVEEFEVLVDDAGKLVEPKCEACSYGVNRQKCALDLGGGCPRHELQDVFVMLLKQDETNHVFKPYGYDTHKGLPQDQVRCSLCFKTHSGGIDETGA